MSGTRTERLDRLRRMERVSVLVVGGGINGISAWRELALQGVDAVLVERGDFMSGASAAPSCMIHGGLRYMGNGEFALVKESLRERNLLLTNAPHTVSPLPTLIPLDRPMTPLAFVELVGIVTVVLLIVGCAYAALAAAAREIFRSPTALRRLNKSAGLMMAGAAVYVVLKD